MDDKISNNTQNVSSAWEPSPLSHCIPWIVVFITECLAIVILNIITIIVFVKQRALQGRSTYLIIHLAVVDLLVGAFSGPLRIENRIALFCNLWKYDWETQWLNHTRGVLFIFPVASLLNLAAISLERAHATVCPFRYRHANRRVYVVIIAGIWLLAIGLTLTEQIFYLYLIPVDKVYFSYFFAALFVIFLSYLCIFVKVRCNRHPQHHNAAGQREGRLTYTLFLVTMGSLLTCLPVMIYQGLVSFNNDFFSKVTGKVSFHVDIMMQTLFLSNSVINPIIYAQRIPELRAGVSQLFQLNRNRLEFDDFPLRRLHLEEIRS